MTTATRWWQKKQPCDTCGKPTRGRVFMKNNPDAGSFPLCRECNASFELTVQRWIMQDEMK
jgi:hypothetical protein